MVDPLSTCKTVGVEKTTPSVENSTEIGAGPRVLCLRMPLRIVDISSAYMKLSSFVFCLTPKDYGV